MKDVKNFLHHKNYNPCGELVGNEREILNEVLIDYFNLPYKQVMRNISLAETAKIQNVPSAVDEYATRNLSDIEMSAGVDFAILSDKQIGLCKYYLHLLFENRYNIFYNHLVEVCKNLDDEVLENINPEELERKIDSIAKDGTYDMTFNDLSGELMNFVL